MRAARSWKQCLLISALSLWTLPAHAEVIGDVRGVEVSAFGTPPGDAQRTLAAGEAVVRDELLETVVGGGVSVIFSDGTEFYLGSASVAKLDKFLYDPAAASGMELGEGVFRLIGSNAGHEELQVMTSTSVIGIRGTDLVIINRPGEGTVVGLASGSITVAGRASGRVVEAVPGQIAVVDPAGDDVVLRSAPVKPGDLPCWLTRDPYICKASTGETAAAPPSTNTGADTFSGGETASIGGDAGEGGDDGGGDDGGGDDGGGDDGGGDDGGGDTGGDDGNAGHGNDPDGSDSGNPGNSGGVGGPGGNGGNGGGSGS